MEIRIAVRSSGTGRQFDYSWKGDNLLKYFDQVKSLIQSEFPSVVIKRQADWLLLVIAGTKSDRVDFRRRTIRNLVIWLVPQKYEEGIRSLAARALRGEIEVDLNQYIMSDDQKQDFKLDENGLRNLVLSSDTIHASPLVIPEAEKPDYQLAKVGEDTKQELAELLENNCLPKRDGVLVVVTKAKSESVLKDAKVWRGLSSNVSSDEFEPYNPSNFGPATILLAVVLVAIVVTLLILNL